MNKGGNRLQVPLVLLVAPHKNDQIKNLGEIHLEKRQQGKHQIPFECQRSYQTWTRAYMDMGSTKEGLCRTQCLD